VQVHVCGDEDDQSDRGQDTNQTDYPVVDVHTETLPLVVNA
jgi:hypothetical protein